MVESWTKGEIFPTHTVVTFSESPATCSCTSGDSCRGPRLGGIIGGAPGAAGCEGMPTGGPGGRAIAIGGGAKGGMTGGKGLNPGGTIPKQRSFSHNIFQIYIIAITNAITLDSKVRERARRVPGIGGPMN